MSQYMVLVGALINIAFTSLYIIATLKGKTKPNKATRILWSIAPIIATIAALSEGVRRAVLPVFMGGFVPFLVFLSSFVNKKAYRKLGRIDYLCGACSLLALILRRITKEANVAIIFAIMSDGLAAIPTIIKGRKYPETENIGAFVGGLLNASTSFFAITYYNFTEIAFPIYLITIDILLISIITIRKRQHKQKH